MKTLSSVLLTVVAVVHASATQAQEAPKSFLYPLAVTSTSDGTVYVADRQLPGIWKISDGEPVLLLLRTTASVRASFTGSEFGKRELRRRL